LSEYSRKGKKIFIDHELDIAGGGLEHGCERRVMKYSGEKYSVERV